MDCDEVMRLLGTTEQRSMTAVEVSALREHAVSCAGCRALAERPIDGPWRWLVRVPAKSLDDPELGMPMVERAVFGEATEVATGGMGRVSRAIDRRLGREVAVKELREERARWRFEREVRITARLQHPAIVPIYEAGAFPDGASFYTMRLVPGRTLQQAIDGAATLADRLRLMPHVRAIADALGYAHARGVIHRDLKPANVLVGEFGETVVIDWGIAKERDREDDAVEEHLPAQTRHTRTGAVMGTPGYMSPAQAAGEPADETDDVYAIGAILYTVLAGAHPYAGAGNDASSLIAATVLDPPAPIDELAPEAPADLRAICARAMSRDKAQRFPTAVELADELARFEAGQLLRSREYTLRELLARWLRRHRRAVALGALGVVALALLAVVWVRYRRAAEELALRARGAQLTALYGDAARQAYRIDRDLLRLESAVEGLAAAAAWALVGPEPPAGAARVYFDVDFAGDKEERPDDFADGSAYRWPVSVEHPVVSVAPGVDRAALLPKIRRLAPLRHHIREMVLEAARGPSPPGISPADANAILRRRESLIDYAYVDLAEGVHMVWPGIASLRRDYDVRTASFFVQSKGVRGTRLGAPYVDSTTDRQGDDLVLPCTRGVWSPTGEFLGVAGVEMTVTKMVETSMAMRTRTTLRATLVDGAGRAVVDSRDARKRFPSSGRDEAIAFPDFDLPDVAAAIRAEREGIVETTRDGRAIVVAVARVVSIGWYYVIEVDADSLGAR